MQQNLYLYPIQNPEEKPVESTIPYLGLKLAYVYLAQEGIEDENSTINNSWLQLGKAHFPHFQGFDGGYVRDPAYGYQVLLNWRKPIHSFPEVNFFDVIEGNIAPDLFTDKIVIVGASSASNDFHVSPFKTRYGETLRGMDIISQATSQFISAAVEGRPLMRIIPEPLEWLLIGISSFLILLCFKENKEYSQKLLIRIVFVAIGLGLAIFSVSFIAFNFSWWLPVVPSILGLLLSTIFLLIYLPINDLIESKKHWQIVAEKRASQLAAQESYVSLGKIAELIAMGFNNSLSRILNQTHSVKEAIDKNLFLLTKNPLQGEEKEKIQEYLCETENKFKEISQECTKIDELIKEIIPYLTTKEKFQLININQILDQAWEWVYYKQKNKIPLEIKSDKKYDKFLPQIPAKFSCEIALRYIIEQAYDSVVKKYQTTEQNYIPTIKVTTENQTDYIEIEISNNGISNQITEKTLQSQIISWIITGIHQGEIYLKSDNKAYTKVKIILPKIQS